MELLQYILCLIGGFVVGYYGTGALFTLVERLVRKVKT